MDIQFLETNHINYQSLINQVIILGDINSKTLGFLPREAFFASVQEKRLIIAQKSGKVHGYLLFRIVKSKYRIAIVHLCVEEEQRGQGIAKKLFDVLKKKYQETFSGISLRCRRDYEASKLWAKLNFIPLDERPARTRGKLLTQWWYSFDKPDLFTVPNIDNKLLVLIDMNIFIHLRDEANHDEQAKQSNSLKADWLSEDLDIYISDEIYIEVDRITDKGLRDKSKKYARKYYEKISYDERKRDEVFQELLSRVPGKKNENDRSDIKHLSNAIAGGADYLVTWDSDLLCLKDFVKITYDFNIITPTDLILKLDELKFPQNYQSERLFTNTIELKLIASGEIDHITKQFSNFIKGEKAHHLKDKILNTISQNGKVKIVYFQNQEKPLAIIAYIEQDEFVEIGIFRILDSPITKNLSDYLLSHILQRNNTNSLKIFAFKENTNLPQVRESLVDSRFYQSGNIWFKVSLNQLLTKEKATSQLLKLNSKYKFHDQFEAWINKKLEDTYEIERSLWNIKITDLNIPCFIVPIKANWAMNLFDIKMSNADLFGGDTERTFNRENVYYRSARNKIIDAPARLLWYISEEKSKPIETKMIKASSYIDEVLVDKPKVLYKMFQKLGIYSWANIYELASQDIEKKIMAFRFSDTEIFSNPIPYKKLKIIYKAYTGKTINLQSPVKIDYSLYIELYKIGKNLKP